MFVARQLAIPVLVVLLGSGSLGACQKGSAEKSGAETGRAPEALVQKANAARRSLEALKPLLGVVHDKYSALREQFDVLPPDLPEFGETRGEFYAATIGVGTLSAKLSWLSDQIDAALKSGDSTALDDIVGDIARTRTQIDQADQLALKMQHRVLPFKQLAAELVNSNGVACENVAAQRPNVVAQQPRKSSAKEKLKRQLPAQPQ